MLSVSTSRHDRSAVALITAIWVGMVVLVNPVGDFPLNDDWAYAWSVRNLLENGDFQLSDWTAVNLLPQVLWGALFSLPLGFSFTALRLSTLTLGLLGVIATYAVLREVKVSPGVSLAGALTLALNPLYFCLANTFMTDVPSLTFTLVSFYFLVRALQRQSTGALLAGLTMALVSILNRQTGLIVLPAFGVAYLLTEGLRPRSIATAVSPSLLGLGLHLVYSGWLRTSERMPYLHDLQTTLMWRSLSSGTLEVAATYSRNLFVVSVYVGLFLLPFLIVAGFAFGPPQSIRRRAQSVAGLLLVGAAAAWAARRHRMPLIGNVLNVIGMGPSAISTSLVGLDLNIHAVRRVWQLVTMAGVVGAALLLRTVVKATRATLENGTRHVTAPCVFAMAMVVLYVLPIGALPRGDWFDRYLIAPLAPLMVVVAIGASDSRRTNWASVVCAIMLVAYGAFTVGATHDYLSWNRARWHAVDFLLREVRVPPEHVNAGFEFNGWFFGLDLDTCNPGRRERLDASGRSWRDFTCLWNTRDPSYLLSPVATDGYRIERVYAFTRWLPPGEQMLYVLHRDAPGE